MESPFNRMVEDMERLKLDEHLALGPTLASALQEIAPANAAKYSRARLGI